jgi:predicted TIM-barrel fold metal-dependent hydrolase
VIDACVFHEWASDRDLVDHMEPGWRKLFAAVKPSNRPELGEPGVRVAPLYSNPLGSTDPRASAGGRRAGSDPSLMRAQLMRSGRRERVVLAFDDGLYVTAYPDPYVATAAARAANDFSAARWLDPAAGVYGLILVASALPDAAAAEIRRVGRDEGWVGVALGANSLGMGFGHPVYRPILRAAAELGLPVVVQANSDVAAPLVTPPIAGGLPMTFAEYKALAVGAASSHVGGMIIAGVFSELPDLRVLLVGGGVSWIPGFLWRHDYYYKLEAHEAPWLVEPPSEYFRRHVRVTTYPLERVNRPELMQRALATVPWLEEVLVYASGYPSYDWEEADSVLERIPISWRQAVLSENADALFRWSGQATASISGDPVGAEHSVKTN